MSVSPLTWARAPELQYVEVTGPVRVELVAAMLSGVGCRVDRLGERRLAVHVPDAVGDEARLELRFYLQATFGDDVTLLA